MKLKQVSHCQKGVVVSGVMLVGTYMLALVERVSKHSNYIRKTFSDANTMSFQSTGDFFTLTLGSLLFIFQGFQLVIPRPHNRPLLRRAAVLPKLVAKGRSLNQNRVMPPWPTFIVHVEGQLVEPFPVPRLWFVDSMDLGHNLRTGSVACNGPIASAVI